MEEKTAEDQKYDSYLDYDIRDCRSGRISRAESSDAVRHDTLVQTNPAYPIHKYSCSHNHFVLCVLMTFFSLFENKLHVGSLSVSAVVEQSDLDVTTQGADSQKNSTTNVTTIYDFIISYNTYNTHVNIVRTV
jgi:hypothetical protein